MGAPEITPADLAAGLRGWFRGSGPHEIAAVELLIWHDYWQRRPDFVKAAITCRAPGLVASLNWDDAREFVDRGFRASTSERAILELAVALGEDQFRLSSLGMAHKRSVVNAFTAAAGLGELVPPITTEDTP